MDLKRILVFRIGHLGDTLVSLPAFWAIRSSFPDAELTLLTNNDAANPQYIAASQVLPKEKLFDKWLDYPTGVELIPTARSYLKLYRAIRASEFDALVYLMTRNRTPAQILRDEVFFRGAGIKKIFGLSYLRKNTIDVRTKKPLPRLDSELEFLIKSLSYDGFPLVPDSGLTADMLLDPDEQQQASEWLAENCGNVEDGRQLIAVAPGSKWSSKVWSGQRFFEVIDRLIEKKGVFPVIFGGGEDRDTGNDLIRKWGLGANAAGELGIRPAAAALKHCRLYLGNDTGTMHLAASVGTPCVAIFAAVDWPGRWEPFGTGHRTFRRQVECEGCFTPNCFNNNKCLDLVGADEVYQACERILDGDGKA